MQRLEVSCAVRRIHVVRHQRVNVCDDNVAFYITTLYKYVHIASKFLMEPFLI